MRHQHGAGCERAGKGATIMHEAACKHFLIAWQCSQGFSSPHARDTAISTLKAWQEVVCTVSKNNTRVRGIMGGTPRR